MVGNERDRLVPTIFDVWLDFADHLVVLDNSDDGFPELAGDARVTVEPFESSDVWGLAHPQARRRLFELAVESGQDYILILDADMTPIRDPHPLLLDGVDAIAFPYYDLWNLDPPLYREDRFWYAHHLPRIWCVRNPGPDFVIEWADGSVHSGHIPTNLPRVRTLVAPPDYGLIHYGYVTPVLRERKAQQYSDLAEKGQLTPFEAQHADTILDPDPHLVPFSYPLDPRLRLP